MSQELDAAKIELLAKRELIKLGTELGGKGHRKPKWTLQLKRGFERCALENGLSHWSSRCSENATTGWLYDVCWLRMQDKMIVDVPLVCESEWTLKDIMHDFQKLIIARAQLRVMVFETRSEEQTATHITEMKRHVRACRQSRTGDRYLFGVWEMHRPAPERKFAFTSYVFNEAGTS